MVREGLSPVRQLCIEGYRGRSIPTSARAGGSASTLRVLLMAKNTDYVICITTKRGRTWSYLKENNG